MEKKTIVLKKDKPMFVPRPWKTRCVLSNPVMEANENLQKVVCQIDFEFQAAVSGKEALFLFNYENLCNLIKKSIQSCAGGFNISVDSEEGYQSELDAKECDAKYPPRLVSHRAVINEFCVKTRQDDPVIFPVDVSQKYLPILRSLAGYNDISLQGEVNNLLAAELNMLDIELGNTLRLYSTPIKEKK